MIRALFGSSRSRATTKHGQHVRDSSKHCALARANAKDLRPLELGDEQALGVVWN